GWCCPARQSRRATGHLHQRQVRCTLVAHGSRRAPSWHDACTAAVGHCATFVRRRHMAIETPIQSEAGRGVRTIRNYIGGQWVASTATDLLDVANPATGETITRVPLSTAEEVDRAARAAQDAFLGWRDTPPLD